MANNKDPIKPVRAQGARTTFFPPYALMIGLIASSLLDSFFIHIPLFKGSIIVLIIGLIIAVSSFLMAIYTLKIFPTMKKTLTQNQFKINCLLAEVLNTQEIQFI